MDAPERTTTPDDLDVYYPGDRLAAIKRYVKEQQEGE